MLDELNELLEGNIIDIAGEGIGTAMGIALLWGVFFGGVFELFGELMTFLFSAF